MSQQKNINQIGGGIFATVETADRAISALVKTGIPKERIGVICSEESHKQHFGSLIQDPQVGRSDAPSPVAMGVLGGFVGGLASVAIVTATGGIGIVAVGPIVGGGLTGTLIGVLVGSGVEDEKARFYDQEVTKGHILVVVDVDDQEQLEQVERLLSEADSQPFELRND